MLKPVIFTAMEMEARGIATVLRLVGAQIDLRVVGIRACRLPAELPEASVIIMAGLAGALDPGLKVGDIVCECADPHPCPLPEYWARGQIHTSDRMISTPLEKAELFRQTGAKAVDMENAIVKREAEKAGIRFVGIRAISDTAADAVDAELFKIVDEVGKVRPMAAAGLFLRNPGLIKQARRLQADSEKALDALGAAVLNYLRQ
jgi:adenosylhomocysteine nucleosidase